MLIRWLTEETVGSLRRIRRRGWNTLHLILILAVGFGCVIGTFDLAYGVLNAPLPFPHIDRIVVAANNHTERVLFAYHQSNPHIGAVFESAAEYTLIDANLDLPQQTMRLRVGMISPRFFTTLGIAMTKGRDFSGTDFFPDPRSQPQWLPIIVSNELWTTYFASSEDILGRSIELNIQPYRYQVVGVAPPGASFPAGVDAWIPVHLVSHLIIQTAGLPAGSGGVVGLLKTEVPIKAAEAVIRTWPKQRLFNSGREDAVQLISLRDFWVGEIYPLSLKLWLASVFFLALIIVAAGTIFQTDAEIRRDEFAIKSALGANARRMLGALSVEAAVVVVLALIAGFAFRFALIYVTAACLALPPGFDASIRAVDLAMAIGVGSLSVTVALVIQGLQLLHLPSIPTSERLGGHSVKGHRMARNLLRYRIPIQVIPATMIVIVAGLFVRSAYNTMHIDAGVQTDNVFVCEVSLSDGLDRFLAGMLTSNMSAAEREEVFQNGPRRFYELMNAEIQEILNTLVSSPGVTHAGAISTAPYRGYGPGSWQAQVSSMPDVPPESDIIPNVISRSMTHAVIPALGMRLLYGRGFSGRSAEDENTIIVNEALAEKVGEGPNALGHYIKLASLPVARIVGVVRNVREEGVYSQVWPTVYYPVSQYAPADVDLVVRASHGVSGRDILQVVQTSVRSASKRASVSRFQQLSAMVASAGTLARYTGYYLLVLAVLAFLLVGFCASAKTVGELHRRKEEVGIRLALGATRARIIRMFLYSDLLRSTVAAFMGALLAWWFSHLLRHLLYNVEFFDLRSYSIGVGALVGSIAAVQIVLLSKALSKDPRDLM